MYVRVARACVLPEHTCCLRGVDQRGSLREWEWAPKAVRVIVPAALPADASLTRASLSVRLLCTRWEGYLDKPKAANVRKPTRIDKVRTTDLLEGVCQRRVSYNLQEC